MAEPRRPLVEELIGEVLFRQPPDQPARLFHALPVSREWRDFVTSPDNLRTYRRFHKAPPVLGFLGNFDRDDDVKVARLTTTATPSPPLCLPDLVCRYSLALDCRHGRVLLHTIQTATISIIICNPITRAHQLLPEPKYPEPPFRHFAGAVLCAVEGCRHLDCRGGHFRVAFVAVVDENVDAVFTWASLYSSETGLWTKPVTIQPGPVMDSPEVIGPSLLAGDELYFTLDLQNNRSVLRYDLGGDALSVMDLPPLVRTRRDTFLVTGDDGGLGVAALEGNSLHLWSLRAAAGGGGWARHRVIDLEIAIPAAIGDPITVLRVIGFAEMSGIIFVSRNGIIYSIEMRSGRARHFSSTPKFNTIFPLEIFYTPGMQGA